MRQKTIFTVSTNKKQFVCSKDSNKQKVSAPCKKSSLGGHSQKLRILRGKKSISSTLLPKLSIKNVNFREKKQNAKTKTLIGPFFFLNLN